MEYQINLARNIVNTVVIESPSLLREFVEQLSHQINGDDGGFVLSENSSELIIGKKIELFVNPFIDRSNAKEFASRLIAKMQGMAVSEGIYQKTNEIQRELLDFAGLLAQSYEGPITFAEEINIGGLLRLLDFSYDFEDCFIENLATYISATNRYFGKDVFIFVNLKSYLEAEELLYILEVVKSNDSHLLLFENIAREPFISGEKCCIIDLDLCEVFSEGVDTK